MATESGFITLEDLKRQAEEIGLEGKEKKKFLTQGWKVIQENEVRKLKLAAETEERFALRDMPLLQAGNDLTGLLV